MDLDRFTTAQLSDMHTQHCNDAVRHWTRARDITRSQADIPWDDQAAFDASVADNRAAMAAGDEQFELAKAIGAVIASRSAVHA